MFIDVKKAHTIPQRHDDVYMELPEEWGAKKGVCGKLNYWLCGFRKAAKAWEKHYADLFESEGFERGEGCGVVFYHEKKDISVVIHGDDFSFCGLEEDLKWIEEKMRGWFEIKMRGES